MNITNVLYSTGCLLWSRLVLNGLRITSCASNPEVYSNKSGMKSSFPSCYAGILMSMDQHNEVPKLPYNIIDCHFNCQFITISYQYATLLMGKGQLLNGKISWNGG